MTTARQPAEWGPHAAYWIGFPSHPDLWEDGLDGAREEVAALARAVHADGAGERVILVAADGESAEAAQAFAGDAAQVIVEPFGDIWLRDTAPIFVRTPTGIETRNFDFNWWGGKYELPGDETIGIRLAGRARVPSRKCPWIFEGGAIDVDGEGLGVTTEQCLLNPNRNPSLGREEIERRLKDDLGLKRLLWLGEGLLNDHTDGHVDNIARFVGPGRLALPVAAGDDDPNAVVFADARARAEAFGVEVVPIPSPGKVIRDDEIIPASYMNFLIGNAAVVVPLYDAPNDAAAVEAVQVLFPTRKAIGLRADTILTGGGSFHCISQQIPAT
jgi:agmatine deiminase